MSKYISHADRGTRICELDEQLEDWKAKCAERNGVIERLKHELADKHQALHSVYEVWAGSEGIPEPVTASEAYLLSLVEQMRDAAKDGMK